MITLSSSNLRELAPYVEGASRIELIVRWFYGIVIGIVFWLWGIWISIVTFIHFFYILFLGRRSPTLYNYTRRFINATAYVSSYLEYLTDDRPNLTPNIIFYFKDVEAAQDQTSTIPSTRFCITCGASLRLDAAFCPKCGKAQK